MVLAEPSENEAGVLVTDGAAGEVVMLPVNVPVLTIFNAGQGTMDEVQASTVTDSGHSEPEPSCRISRWSYGGTLGEPITKS